MWDSCLENGVATLACIPIIIKNVVTAALAFSGIVALVIIIFAGARYISSKGDEAKIESAKKTLTYAFVGLGIIFLSFFIMGLLSTLTGVDQLKNPTL